MMAAVRVVMRGQCLSLALLLLAPAVTPAKKPFREKRLPVERQAARQHFVNPEDLIASLGITKGMTIVDIGSGPGFVSGLFADALQGTGKVFATDISPQYVGLVADADSQYAADVALDRR